MILIMVRSKPFNLGQAQQFIDQNVPKPRAISSNSLVLVFMNTLNKNPLLNCYWDSAPSKIYSGQK